MGSTMHCENFGLMRARYVKPEIVPLQNWADGYALSEALKIF